MTVALTSVILLVMGDTKSYQGVAQMPPYDSTSMEWFTTIDVQHEYDKLKEGFNRSFEIFSKFVDSYTVCAVQSKVAQREEFKEHIHKAKNLQQRYNILKYKLKRD